MTGITKQRGDDANGTEVEMTLAFGAERHILEIPINALNLELTCTHTVQTTPTHKGCSTPPTCVTKVLFVVFANTCCGSASQP